jgi:hypothetical protein
LAICHICRRDQAVRTCPQCHRLICDACAVGVSGCTICSPPRPRPVARPPLAAHIHPPGAARTGVGRPYPAILAIGWLLRIGAGLTFLLGAYIGRGIMHDTESGMLYGVGALIILSCAYAAVIQEALAEFLFAFAQMAEDISAIRRSSQPVPPPAGGTPP